MSGNHNKYQGEAMSALQIWLRNHNKRLTQDAIEEALMEYIESVERQLAQAKAIITEQKEIMQINFEEQSALIEKLGLALKRDCLFVIESHATEIRIANVRDAIAAFEEWRAK